MAREGEFIVAGEKHVIGDKMFPVASLKNTLGLNHQNTTPYDNMFLSELLDPYAPFEAGRCYQWAEYVVAAAKKIDLAAEYFAGWVFLGQHPVHHAWAVIYDTGLHVIDLSFSPEEVAVWAQVDPNKDPNWRVTTAPKIAAIHKKPVTC